MGTRHLIAVYHQGAYRVAQYGQWDGYPSGKGVELLAILRHMPREQLLPKIETCRFATEEELKALVDDDQWLQKFPQFDRDHGCKILNLIAQSEAGLVLQNKIEFAGDSLFCEWAYVIDFDKNKLEVFRGFNHEPLAEKDRFYAMEGASKNPKYHPVRQVAEFDLAALPDDGAFCAQCEPAK